MTKHPWGRTTWGSRDTSISLGKRQREGWYFKGLKQEVIFKKSLHVPKSAQTPNMSLSGCPWLWLRKESKPCCCCLQDARREPKLLEERERRSVISPGVMGEPVLVWVQCLYQMAEGHVGFVLKEESWQSEVHPWLDANLNGFTPFSLNPEKFD